MYKKPSPTLIGAFVTGAVLLLIGGLVFFGSGLLFSEKQIFVLFFNGSLKGLDVGSPVTFRGVPIGQVKKIKILVDPETGLSKMPVYIAINPKSLFSYSGTGSVSELGREAMEAMIARRGLRGQLQIQSLVTGKLLVDLDFHPETPARYVGLDKNHVEIPTVPSTVENIVRTFQEMRVDRLVNKLIAAIDSIDKLVKSGKVEATIDVLHASIVQLQTDMKTLMPELVDTMKSIRSTSSATKGFVQRADRKLDRISAELDRLATSANGLVERVNRVAGHVESMVGPGSRERYELQRMLKEIAGAARSLRILSESISAQPDVLIKGRQGQKSYQD